MTSPFADHQLVTLAQRLVELRDWVAPIFSELAQPGESAADTACRLADTYGSAPVGIPATLLYTLLQAYHAASQTTTDPSFLAPHLRTADSSLRRASYGPPARDLG